MLHTSRLPRTCSFRILTRLVTPHIHLNIFILAGWIVRMFFFCVKYQVSMPYTDLTIVLWPLRLIGNYLLQATPVTCLHFSRATASLYGAECCDRCNQRHSSYYPDIYIDQIGCPIGRRSKLGHYLNLSHVPCTFI